MKQNKMRIAVSATNRSSKLRIGLALCVLCAISIHAEGFRNPPAGSFNLGRAGGRIAQVEDPSAIAENPANLVDITNVQAQFTPSIIYIKTEFTSTSGLTAETKEPWKLLPNLFISAPVVEGRVSVGLGLTTPYGIENKWDRNSAAFSDPTSLRYQAPFYARLLTINTTPTISIKAADFLTFGAGLDIMWSELHLKQFYPWFLGVPGAPDGSLNANASGVGVGANFGATLHLTERQRLAITARTPIRIDYDGHVAVDNVPAVLGGGSIRGEFGTHITFPTIIAGGYGIELNDRIRVEADVEWLQFSKFDKLPIEGTTARSLGLPAAIPQNWKDTFTVGIAGDWRLDEKWTLRGGYRFYESPIPDSTFSPTIPDANQNVITLGINFVSGRHSFEGAYGLDFYDTRNIRNDSNPAFNGKYEITVHLFSLSYAYSF